MMNEKNLKSLIIMRDKKLILKINNMFKLMNIYFLIHLQIVRLLVFDESFVLHPVIKKTVDSCKYFKEHMQ